MRGVDWEIAGRGALTETEIVQVRELIARCNDAEHLDLKVEIGGLRAARAATSNIFLAHVGQTLAGFCTLDGGREIELCGAVHPDYRHRGIASALLDAARTECQRRSAEKLLLICEDDSRSGQGFLATLDMRREFGEHRMLRDTNIAGVPAAAGTLVLRPATTGDEQAIAHITTLAFERDEADERQRLATDMLSLVERFFLALHGSAPVGTLKIFADPPRALIYGFAVAPEYQGRGYGREILNQTLRLLAEEGWTQVGLEVETDNHRAYNLYISAGFQRITTYGYYALAV